MYKKKSVYLAFAIFLILALPFIMAQAEETDAIDKAYACLEQELGDNCGNTKSTKQASFNLLGGSYDSSIQNSCKSALTNLKQTNCWSDSDTGNCNIKSTALATLALQQIDEDIDDQIEYLLEKRKLETGLTWYLEIDSTNRTICDINGKSITVEDNKKLSGSPPTGLSRAYNDYWFQINNIEKNYTISCDKDFITALLYQKPGSNVFHVSSETQSASEFDTITERVNSYCIATGSECDYEGTLWASLVLKKEGEDVSALIPYLTSMADRVENKKYIPSAVLYILTNEDEYYSELISLQKTGNFWDESRNKFYDTALALLALQDVNSDEVDSAKKYLLNVQKDNGCWQSDTAFILHAGWPKNPTGLSGGGGGITYCEDFGHFCVSIGECALTEQLDNFFCTSSAQVCCSAVAQEPTCAEKGGGICNLDQECSGSAVTSLDSNFCCVGNCIEIQTENDCETNSFFCKNSCGDSQEEKAGYTSACSLGDICCGSKAQEEGSNFWLIVLLIILIILVIIAIIFRNQLKVFFFKRKSKTKETKLGTPSRPGTMPLPAQRVLPRPPPRGTRRRGPSGRDKEFDDTMKKLRDMSK
jgi:hypothetical protein